MSAIGKWIKNLFAGKKAACEPLPDDCFFCRYAVFGGMEDGLLEITLAIRQSGAELNIRERREPNAQESRSRFFPPLAEAEKVSEAYRLHGIEQWEALPPKKEMALDAPVTSLYFKTPQRESRIDNTMELPEDSRGLLFEFYEMLMGLKTVKNR